MKFRKSALRLGMLVFMMVGASYAGETGASAEYRLSGKKIELARYAKAYVGQGNVTVEVAPYKTEDRKSGAILLFKGIEGPWDGKAINHRLEPGTYNATNYVTDYEGREWTTLIAGRDGYEGKSNLLYVPEVKDEIKLAPSDGAAQLTSPAAIFQEYQRQQGLLPKEGEKK